MKKKTKSANITVDSLRYSLQTDSSISFADAMKWIKSNAAFYPQSLESKYSIIKNHPMFRALKQLADPLRQVMIEKGLLNPGEYDEGLTIPSFYISVPFRDGKLNLTYSSLHTEDLMLASANYCLSGGNKWWVIFKRDCSADVVEYLRESFPSLYKNHCRTFHMHKSMILISENIKKTSLFRKYGDQIICQKAGDLVVTKASAFHFVINCGYSVNIAVNFLDYSYLVELPYQRSKQDDFFTNCVHQPPQPARIHSLTPNDLRRGFWKIPNELYLQYDSERKNLRLRSSIRGKEHERTLLKKDELSRTNVLEIFSRKSLVFEQVRDGLIAQLTRANGAITDEPKLNLCTSGIEGPRISILVDKVRRKLRKDLTEQGVHLAYNRLSCAISINHRQRDQRSNMGELLYRFRRDSSLLSNKDVDAEKRLRGEIYDIISQGLVNPLQETESLLLRSYIGKRKRKSKYGR
jgi:hypothetical protein